MAQIDFPATPSVGQQFTPASGVTYTWNGTLWLATSGSGGASSGASVSASATPTWVLNTRTVVTGYSGMAGNENGYLNSTNGRFTPPAGRYFICAYTYNYGTSAAAPNANIILRKNGNDVYTSSLTYPAQNFWAALEVAGLFDLNGTDYVDFCTLLTNTGSAAAGVAIFTAFPITGVQGPPGPPGATGVGDFSAKNSATIALAGTQTIVKPDTVTAGNAGSWYSTSTGRYTPPAGRYQISSAMSFNGSGTIGAALTLYKNGVEIHNGLDGYPSGSYANIAYTALVSANGSDYFEWMANGTGAGANIIAGTLVFSSIPLTGAVGPQGPAGQMVNIGVTPPSASPGVLWWNSELGQLFLRYDDGNTSQWVPAATPQSQPVQQGWRSLGSVNFTTPQATIDFQNLPSDINYLMLMGQMRPVTNGVMCYLRVYDGAGALVTAAGYHTYGTVQAGLTVAAPAQYTNMNGGSFVLNSVSNMISNNIAPGGGVGFDVKFFAIRNTGNFRRRMTIASNWLNSTDTDVFSYYASGEYGNVSTPVTGLQLMFHTGAIAAAQVELWGAP